MADNPPRDALRRAEVTRRIANARKATLEVRKKELELERLEARVAAERKKRDLSTSDIAKAMGVTGGSTVVRWIQDGCPADKLEGVRGRGGCQWKLNLEEVREWLEARGIHRGRQVPGLSSTEEQKLKLEKLRSDAKLARLRASQLEGSLLNAEDVAAAQVRKIHRVKAAMEAVPTQLADSLVGLDRDEIEVELRAAMRDLCEQFASEDSE